MVVVLDTNHFTEFASASNPGRRLRERLLKEESQVFSCIVSAEESLRGWMALIRSRANGLEQLDPYARLLSCIDTLAKFTILPFDQDAALTFHRLRSEFPRIGSMDLKIASMCITHEATLLSRNLVDFAGISDLRTENLLD